MRFSHRPRRHTLLRRRRQPTEKKGHRPLLILLLCVAGSLVFAVVLGLILGAIASRPDPAPTSKIPVTSLPVPTIPSLTVPDLNAYTVDLSGNSASELKERTAFAREHGNAIVLPMQKDGVLLYTSEQAKAFGLSSASDLSLSRIRDYFTMDPPDYLVGIFASSFGGGEDVYGKQETRARELALLAEAAKNGFSELIVAFPSDAVTEDNILALETYLLDLRSLVGDLPVGVVLPSSLRAAEKGRLLIDKLAAVCDFVCPDLRESADPAADVPSWLYEAEKHRARLLLPFGDKDAFAALLDALEKSKITSWIAVTP